MLSLVLYLLPNIKIRAEHRELATGPIFDQMLQIFLFFPLTCLY